MHVRAFGMMVNFSGYLLNDKDVIKDVILQRVIFLPSVLFSRFVFLNECDVEAGMEVRCAGCQVSPPLALFGLETPLLL